MRRRSAHRLVASCCLVLLVAHPHADHGTHAFEVSRRTLLSPRRATRPFAITSRRMMTMLHKQPGESESAYMNRIQQLAADPKAFERAVLHPKDSTPGSSTTTALHHHQPSKVGGNSTDSGDAPPRKSGYQRVEDWDREQQEQQQQRGGSMSWEERVQFDGQRYGNRFQQNEVLRHHLKTF